MTTTTTLPDSRPVPTVQTSPELLVPGDTVHPDLPLLFDATAGDPTFTVAAPAEPLRDRDGALVGWQIPLNDGRLFSLLVPAGGKVRTDRRYTELRDQVHNQILRKGRLRG